MNMAGHDPVHIPSANLVVWHKGREALLLNKALLDKQNCWGNLTRILELHSERLHLEDEMRTALSFLNRLAITPEAKETIVYYWDFLMLCDAYYTQIEYELQEAWGFPLDDAFHRFWNRPGCRCPKMDNEDIYPSKISMINRDCSLHGYSVPSTGWTKILNFFKGVFNG